MTHGKYPRTYKVVNVGSLGADRQTFLLTQENGQTTDCTVQRYFANTYGKVLRYPKLNCLRVGPTTRNIYLPIEVSESSMSNSLVVL